MTSPLLPPSFPPPEAPPSGPWRNPLLAALALFLAVAALYRPALDFRLLAFDDAYYTVGNDLVTGGLTGASVARAFTEIPEKNLFIPLAHISLMADVELSGVTPRGFHRTNVLLHGANMALLSLLLWRLTGSPWKALFAAALVALHPMRVESVAWVTERKGLLSSFFLLLAVGCHLRHVRSGRGRWYALLLLCFLLSLLSKPTAMVLPLLLLLLDAWPLGRLAGAGEGGATLRERVLPVLREKVPLLALSVAAGLLTARLQAGGGSLHAAVPLPSRVEHALAAPFVYLYQTAWPPSLAFRFFDTPWNLLSGTLLPAAAATGAVTLLALRQGERRPFLAFGWLWFVLFLLPHGGLLPSGAQWISDRFTYLPHAGVAVACVWAAAGSVPPGPLRSRALPAAGLLLLALLAFQTRGHLGNWRDGAALFGHGLAANGDDPSYRDQYVDELLALGDVPRARAALEPLLPRAHEPGIGPSIRLHHVQVLEGGGDREGAIAAAREYLRRDPSAWKMRLLLSDALLAADRFGEAEGEYRALLGAGTLPPGFETAHVLEGLGIAMAETGRGEEALACYREGLRRNPASVSLHYHAARLLARQGDGAAAARHLDEALRLDPGNDEVARERERLSRPGTGRLP